MDFRTGKPVNMALDWTGHVASSANHCTRSRSEIRIVCKQGNNAVYCLTNIETLSLFAFG